MTVTNTHYDTKLITAVKGFIAQTTEAAATASAVKYLRKIFMKSCADCLEYHKN